MTKQKEAVSKGKNGVFWTHNSNVGPDRPSASMTDYTRPLSVVAPHQALLLVRSAHSSCGRMPVDVQSAVWIGLVASHSHYCVCRANPLQWRKTILFPSPHGLATFPFSLRFTPRIIGSIKQRDTQAGKSSSRQNKREGGSQEEPQSA